MENADDAIKWAILQGNAVVHVTTNAGNVATLVILKCAAIPNKAKSENQAAVRVVVAEIVEENQIVDEKEKEMFFIHELRPTLNVQSDSIRAKVFN